MYIYLLAFRAKGFLKKLFVSLHVLGGSGSTGNNQSQNSTANIKMGPMAVG
jgi:hypothetical protein